MSSTTSAAPALSLTLPSLNTKALSFSKPTSLSFLSFNPTSSLSLSFNPFHQIPSCRFVRNVALSSEFGQEEEVLSDGDERSYSEDLKLFVGNLPFNVDSAQLADLFSNAGNVEVSEVIYDKATGRSRGFGFVTMSSTEEVEAAVDQFNGYEIEGRAIRVNSGPAPPKESSFSRGPRGGGDSYGSRGGGDSYGSRRGSDSYGSRGGGDSYGSRRGSDSYGSRGGGDSYGSRRGSDSYGSRGGDESYGSRGGGESYGSRGGGESYGSRGGGGSSDAKRVYVGNLSWNVDNVALERKFSEQGKVLDAKVVYDRESGRSRGFGFVSYGSSQEVDSAIESLNGVEMDGRSIRVSAAESRPPRSQY